MQIKVNHRTLGEKDLNLDQGELIMITEDPRKNKPLTAVVGVFLGIDVRNSRARVLLGRAYMIRSEEEFGGSKVPIRTPYLRGKDGYSMSRTNFMYAGKKDILAGLRTQPELEPHARWVESLEPPYVR